MPFSPDDYGPVVADALAPPRLMPLGAGMPTKAGRERLADFEAGELFPGDEVVDEMALKACMAALWLYHDHLDRAHALGQEVETPEGHYWHGIMHRREGDFGNARYWFTQVGAHPIHPQLAAAAQEVVRAARDPVLAPLLRRVWDPFAFVDACQRLADDDSDSAKICRQLQQREWELLFDHCYRKAVGRE